ncbi:MAG: 50S ribosomal protein L28 [Chloroflexi bacterium]|nr:50S ribosomal protein L28 [Chloroflexota bacterium]
MMAKCEICGKGPRFGNSVSHSKKSSKRSFRPNIQRKRVMIDGQMRRVNICTRCLRTLSHKGSV